MRVSARFTLLRPPVPGILIAIAMALVLDAPRALAATYYVDAANTKATDIGTGAGASATPYKTIQAAVTARAIGGNTIIVKPSIYRESVAVTVSGALKKLIVIKTSGPGVVVSGSDDFAGTAKWTLVSGNVYLASSVTWQPLQVFANGARLDTSSVTPASLPSNKFRYVSGTGLYVNAGGGNPGLKNLEVGRRGVGIDLVASYVTIDGFEVTRTDDRGIYVHGAVSNSIVQNCTVSFARSYGLHVDAATAMTVFKNFTRDNGDHGISVTASPACKVQNNESFRNARPTTRAANGINVHSSPGSIVENNRCYDNQDSGLQYYNGSDNCISRNNLSWNNGDHGYDHVASAGVMHFHDVAYGNFKDGFSIEGNSPGAKMYNCISANNGLTVAEYDLWVDPASTVGFVADYNLFWNGSNRSPFKFGATAYATLGAYQVASGQDLHSRQSNPRFLLPAAGNFRLMSNSPAIDAARSGIVNAPTTDAAAAARYDDTATPNTGFGNPAYADMGVYEYRPSGNRPIASLRLTPAKGESPLDVTADASLSTDPSGAVIAYTFDFGDGTVVGPQATALATHRFGAGNWPVSVMVADAIGQVAIATVIDSVKLGDLKPVVSAPATITAYRGQAMQLNVTASDVDSPSITSLTADLSGLPAGNNAVFTANAARTAGTLVWTPTASEVRAAPYNVTFTAANAKSASTTTAISVQQPNAPPVPVLAATPQSGAPPMLVTASAAGSFDPDGTVVSYQFDFGDGTVVGPQAAATATHSYGLGNWEVRLTVVDDRGASVTSAPVMVQVLGLGPNLVTNNSFESGITGWAIYGADTLYRVAGGQSGNFALEMRAAAGDTALFGCNDAPNWVLNSGASGTRYRFTAWVRSNAHRGLAKLRLREFNGAVQIGSVKLSTGTVLSPTWQPITMEYNTLAGGSTLDFNVIDDPVVAGETFQVDNISIQQTSLALPVITMPAAVTGPENTPITFTVTVSDPDGDPITGLVADLSGLPAGHNATFATNASRTEGTFTWTPGFAHARDGMYPVNFIATSGISGATSGTVPIVVTNVDRAPVVTAPSAVTTTEGELMTLAVQAADADGDTITSLVANLAGLPAGHRAVFTPNATRTAGTLSWTPTYADSGVYTVSFTAANAMSSTGTTIVTVRYVDRAPVVTAPASVSGSEGAPIVLTVSASDPDGEALTVLSANLAGLPAGHGAVFVPSADRSSGSLSWTPSFADSGSYTVVFTTSNALSGTTSSVIRVANVDRAPIVTSPAAVTAIENGLLTVEVTASDPDGDAITSLGADLAGLPASNNAVFTRNAAGTAGTLTWTPAPSAVRAAPYPVVFTAANALSNVSSTAITVLHPNTLPTAVMSATPQSGSEPLVVTLNASTSFDADGVIASYTFNFGDGTSVGPQASPVATHSYALGNWNARVTVVDDRGGSAISAPVMIQVLGLGANLVGNPSFETNVTGWGVYGADTLIRVAGGQSGSFALEMRSAASNLSLFGCNDSPNWVTNAGPAGTRYRFSAWVRSAAHQGKAKLRLREFSGAQQVGSTQLTAGVTLTPNWQLVSFDYNTLAAGSSLDLNVVDAPVLAGEAFQVDNISIQRSALALPVVGAPSAMPGSEGTPITFTVTAADPSGDPITGLTVDVSALPAGHHATFVTNASKTQGTFSWTPSYSAARVAPYTVTFFATSGAAGTGSTSVPMVIANVDPAPVVVVPAAITVAETGSVSFPITATDPDGSAITALNADLSAFPVGGNAAFSTNPGLGGGTFTWSPGYSDSGTYVVTFTASNSRTTARATTIRVSNVDRAPVVTAVPSATVSESGTLTVEVSVSDADGDAIAALGANFAVLPAGSDAVFTPEADHHSGTFVWNTSYSSAGDYALVFTAVNAMSATATTALHVENVDRSPVISAPEAVTALEGTPITIDVIASDPDGDSIVRSADLYAIPALGNAAFVATAAGGTFTWTPTHADSGTYTLVFTAGNVLTASAITTLQIANVDRAPVASVPASSEVIENQMLTLEFAASDPDGDAFTAFTADLSGLPLPNDAVFTERGDHTGGTLTWTPQTADAPGSYTVGFRAENAMVVVGTSVIVVRRFNHAPQIDAPATAGATEGQPLTIHVSASDVDGDAITALEADLSSLPAGHNAVFTLDGTGAAGDLTWTPTYADAASLHVITFKTRAGAGVADADRASAVTEITVSNVDRAPVVVAPPAVFAAEGGVVHIEVSASDPDGDVIDALSADLSGLPEGNDALFVTQSGNTAGTLTWTPGESDGAGPFVITFHAQNALSASAASSVSRGRRPVVSVVSDVMVNENQQLSVTVMASDPDGDAIDLLTADLAGLPAGDARFTISPDHTSGTLEWTPTFADGRALPYAVTFRAANMLSGTGAVAISVANVDRGPVVTVQPAAAANENQALAFTVSASDPDGEPISTLSANLSGLPAGATFIPNGNATGGTFQWTPSVGSGRVAPYLVTFTASNALADSGTAAITVNALPVAALTLTPSSGVAPVTITANASGSSDLDGTIVSYTFNFGDGTIVGPQAAATATRVYGAGSYTVSVVVVDNQGASATVSQTVTVTSNLCGNPGFENASTGWSGSGSAVVSRVAGGRTGSYCLNVQGPGTTATFGATDSPNWITTTPAIGTRYRFTAWVRSDAGRGIVKIKVREYLSGVLQGTAGLSASTALTSGWQQVTYEFTCIKAGSTLDFEMGDTPATASESFQMDDVSITIVPAGSAAMLQTGVVNDAALAFTSTVLPNPIRGQGEIGFTTTRSGRVRVEILDVSGRTVQMPLDAFVGPGRHGVPIRSRGVMTAGVYFYRVIAEEGVRSGRLVVID